MKQEVARHIDVVAAVIRKGDTVFLARRAEGEHLAGYWEFPGGKIELGESPEASLERELGEEFGITARTGACLARTVHEYPGKVVRLAAYEVEHVRGEFRPTVHDEVKWVKTGDLLAERLAPADIPIAEHVQKLCLMLLDVPKGKAILGTGSFEARG